MLTSLSIVLKSSAISKIVGQVVAYSLAADGKSVEVTIFVDAPYDKYVTAETRFWN